jgi:aryl-alcohol dehydrogenase-like predicted oxidoreductase
MTQLSASPSIPGIAKPVSRLALGTAYFNRDQSPDWHALLDAFVNAGGTLIDSARAYGDSEKVIGQWLAKGLPHRERLVLITKGAHGPGLLPEDGWPAVLHEELDQSLTQLGVDYVDLYFLHRDNQEIPVDRLLGPLNEELDRGRVRAIGASNWEYRRVREADAYARDHGLISFAAVSNTLSLAAPAAAFYPGLVSVDSEGEAWHRDTRVPLIPWSSQARGFFAGACPRPAPGEERPAEKSFSGRMQTVYGTDANFQRRDRAAALGQQKGGYSATQVALAYLLHKPFPLAPVVGPRSPSELADCLRATGLVLSPEELAWLNLERDAVSGVRA